jgi:hypothetical protein
MFVDDLESLINRHSLENDSNTPDFILASHLKKSLDSLNKTIQLRDDWYKMKPEPGRYMSMDDCREKSAQVWCDKRTEGKSMDADLAEVFAETLYKFSNR